ncbi:High mobility group B protein 15 [Platanthera guangdongensis]|uniref:High mobility group B protein 15 n=1 Tax=Platanthera guangdongensis TaxID=2320717 RepID=A0ABR2MFV7_9ASPA
MSLDKDHHLPTTTPPPLSVVPIQSQPSPPPPPRPPSPSPQPPVAAATRSYEDVVADESLFMATLEALHRSLGTKFMVPKVGGRPLDLHRLFVEVTSRGGLQTWGLRVKIAVDRRNRRGRDGIEEISFWKRQMTFIFFLAIVAEVEEPSSNQRVLKLKKS